MGSLSICNDLISPVSDKSTARNFVFGNWASMMVMIDMIGTDNNIPGIPQMNPQKVNEITTTKGLRLRDLPVNFGSI